MTYEEALEKATPFTLMQDEEGPDALYDVYTSLSDDPLFTTPDHGLAQFVVGACNSVNGLMEELEGADEIRAVLAARLQQLEGVTLQKEESNAEH